MFECMCAQCHLLARALGRPPCGAVHAPAASRAPTQRYCCSTGSAAGRRGAPQPAARARRPRRRPDHHGRAVDHRQRSPPASRGPSTVALPDARRRRGAQHPALADQRQLVVLRPIRSTCSATPCSLPAGRVSSRERVSELGVQQRRAALVLDGTYCRRLSSNAAWNLTRHHRVLLSREPSSLPLDVAELRADGARCTQACS